MDEPKIIAQEAVSHRLLEAVHAQRYLKFPCGGLIPWIFVGSARMRSSLFCLQLNEHIALHPELFHHYIGSGGAAAVLSTLQPSQIMCSLSSRPLLRY